MGNLGSSFWGLGQMRQKFLTFTQKSLGTGQVSVRQSQTFKSNFNIDLSMNVKGEARRERAADACITLPFRETLLLGP